MNCLKHLQNVKVTNVEGLEKLPVSELKAIGFLPEVRARLQRALKGQEAEIGPDGQQEQVVTIDEEEEALEDPGKNKKNAKKKKVVKPAVAKQAPVAAGVVPGQDGVTLDPGFAELLARLGLLEYGAVFERNNMPTIISCRLLTREALIGNLGIPADKAGILLSHIMQRVPVTHDRRMPELANDLAAAVASMHVTENVREQTKTALQTNHLLSVADAKAKRYAPLLLYIYVCTYLHAYIHTYIPCKAMLHDEIRYNNIEQADEVRAANKPPHHHRASGPPFAPPPPSKGGLDAIQR